MKTILTNAIARFKSTHKAVRITTYLILSYLTYAALIGLALPPILEAKAPDKIKELIGRDVTIGEVRINPFLLRFEVNQLSVAENESASERQDDFVSIAQIKTEFNFWESALSFTPTLEYFYVTKPDINLARLSRSDDGVRFNFSDIPEHIASQKVEGEQPKTEVTPEDTSEGIFAFRARQITLQDGRIGIKDHITGANLGYQSIDIALTNLDTQAFSIQIPDTGAQNKATLSPEANKYSLSLAGIDNSQLDIKGQFQLYSLEVLGDIELANLQLAPFWPLTEQVVAAELTSGVINLSSQYHLQQEGEQINISTEDGQFSLSDLTFSHKEDPKLKLANLTLSDIKVSTEKSYVDIGALTLAQPWVNAVLDKAGVDLQKYFVPEAKEKSSEEAATGAETAADQDAQPWLVTLDAFEMQNADINLKEKMVSDGVFWRVFGFDLSTGPLVSDLSAPIDYQLGFDIGSAYKKQPEKSRGKYSSKGKVDGKALTVDSEMQLSKLQLKQFQRYIDPHLNIILNKGTLDVSGNVQADSEGKLDFKGQSTVDSFLIRDELEKEPLVQWKKVSVDSIDFSRSKNALKINTILFDELFSKVIITKDQKTNVGDLTENNEQAGEPAASKESVPKSKGAQKASNSISDPDAMALDVRKIIIKDGSAFFADYSLTPNFASGIELMNGEISNISSNPAARAKVDIQGKIDKYAPVKLEGEVNPLAVPPYLDLDFKVDSAELTSVNTYSGTYAGYYIDKGLLSLTVNYKLENNILEGKNHVVVDQLTLGKRSESDLATSLPVSLAVSLLKDSDGVIDLGFGVSGDVDSPDFSFGGAIMTVLGNIITKAITAPFSLLADLVGSDEDLDFVDFEAGTDSLDSAAQSRLDKLAEALVARPGLNISVEGSVLAAEDSKSLAEQQFHSKLQKLSGVEQLPSDLSASRISDYPELTQALEALFTQELSNDLSEEREKMVNYLKEQKQSEDAEITPEELNQALHISIYNQLLTAQDISTNDLGNLAQSRAKSVKAYLVEKEINPGRVYILDSKAKLKTEERKALMTIEME
ncbi:DUF748 domain-containing protein [Vibrio hannami]|uniref:DUF748 domain-containing protein n=1 Tax=Vibrio hannami TaxID=2717094 RepID=UPI00240F1730|nr:DUF748 domain-containing protein [Vibrio hannami]MDG3087892.1 DUF748 domain-containing protein [Vibrio hannami]